MDKISWTDRVKSEVLRAVQVERESDMLVLYNKKKDR